MELVAVAVDEHVPGALMGGVAAFGLLEDSGDDGLGVLFDAGEQPLVGRGWTGRGGLTLAVVARHDVRDGPDCGGGVEDGSDLGHPFPVARLSRG